MNDHPDAQDLLATARDTYAAEVLPALPERLRYTGLMIANAMAIAQRWIEAGEAPARAELERLRSLSIQRSDGFDRDALQSALAAYNHRLADEIRAGRFDDQERAALIEHLRRTTEEKLAISNPKLLK